MFIIDLCVCICTCVSPPPLPSSPSSLFLPPSASDFGCTRQHLVHMYKDKSKSSKAKFLSPERCAFARVLLGTSSNGED